jgi:hypothetical protein
MARSCPFVGRTNVAQITVSSFLLFLFYFEKYEDFKCMLEFEKNQILNYSDFKLFKLEKDSNLKDVWI